MKPIPGIIVEPRTRQIVNSRRKPTTAIMQLNEYIKLALIIPIG